MHIRCFSGCSMKFYVISTLIILLSTDITTPAFADANENNYGYSPIYDLCIKYADVYTSRVLMCNEAESEYQDWRLNTAYRSLIEILSPVSLNKLRQEERAWIKKRKFTCALPKDAGSIAVIDSSSCFLDETAKQAEKLENLLKENKK